jgi:hypothetical protein
MQDTYAAASQLKATAWGCQLHLARVPLSCFMHCVSCGCRGKSSYKHLMCSALHTIHIETRQKCSEALAARTIGRRGRTLKKTKRIEGGGLQP